MNEKEFQNENEFQNFLIAQTFRLIGYILIPDYVMFIQEKQSDFFFIIIIFVCLSLVVAFLLLLLFSNGSHPCLSVSSLFTISVCKFLTLM